MTRSFEEYLSDHTVDPDTIQQATRYYLAERLDDLSPEEMRQQLVEALNDENAVDSLLQQLERDSDAVEQASLMILSSAWEEPEQAELVGGAICDAKKKLPVIETGIIAIVVMYGFWLIKTGGIKRAAKTVRRKPDGSFEKKEITEFYNVTGALSPIVALFKAKMGF